MITPLVALSLILGGINGNQGINLQPPPFNGSTTTLSTKFIDAGSEVVTILDAGTVNANNANIGGVISTQIDAGSLLAIIIDAGTVNATNENTTGVTSTAFLDAGLASVGSTNVTGSLTTTQLATPVNATFTAGAGSCSAATYYYRVSARDSTGQTLGSTETSLAVGASSGVNVNWAYVNDAVSYNVYGRTTGAEQLIANVTAPTLTYLDTCTISPSGALPAMNTTANILMTTRSRICLDGATCSADVYWDTANINLGRTGNKPLFIGGNLLVAGGSIAPVNNTLAVNAASGSTLSLGTITASTHTTVVGTSGTTFPVQIAGGSGAFVGTCTMVAGTSCTATVPSGAVCMCFPQTTIGVSTNEAYGAVSSTTFTCNSGGTSNSATWSILCL